MTQRQGEMRETYPVPGDVYRYQTDEREDQFTFSVAYDSEGESLAELPPAVTLSIESRESGEGLCREESGRIHAFAWAWVGPELHLWLEGALYVFQRAEIRRRGSNSAAVQAGDITAPMPGTVLDILVSEGERVEQNQTVMVMESMKMELLITAPRDGIVQRVAVQPGQQVERGMRLLELASEGEA